MKNFSVLDLALLAALGFGSVLCASITTAIAAEETPVAVPAVERMRAKAETRAETRAERREALESTVQDRVINLANNVTGRLTAALDRMSNIAVRIDSRIAKLDTMGVETSLAKTRLAEAQKVIEDARTKLKNIPSIDNGIRGDAPRESFATIRAEFVIVRDLARQSHALLIDTVVILKEAMRSHESVNSTRDTVSVE